MAGRIRSIKPEILEDEKTAALSHLQWRLFVSLWLIADDYGNLRGEPGYVQGQTLWAANETRGAVAGALDALTEVGLLTRYVVRGQTYHHITGWLRHQKVDKPGKPRMPGPDDPESVESSHVETILETVAGSPREPRETLAPDLRPPTPTRTPTENPPPARAPAIPQQGPGTVDVLWDELELERKRVSDHHRIPHRPMVAHDAGRSDLATALVDSTKAGKRDLLIGQARHAIAVAGAEAQVDRSKLQWLTGAIFQPKNFRRLAVADLAQARQPPRQKNDPLPPAPARKVKPSAPALVIPPDEREDVAAMARDLRDRLNGTARAPPRSAAQDPSDQQPQTKAAT